MSMNFLETLTINLTIITRFATVDYLSVVYQSPLSIVLESNQIVAVATITPIGLN